VREANRAVVFYEDAVSGYGDHADHHALWIEAYQFHGLSSD